MAEPWVLLVEDDKIFAMLFCRIWQTQVAAVSISVAGTLEEMRQHLERAEHPPRLIILDRSLPDGNGHEVACHLATPYHCWSAVGEGGTEAKPQGRAALEAVVRTLAQDIGF